MLRRWRMSLGLIGCAFLLVLPVLAQAVNTITVGETVEGEIGEGNTAPSYFFDGNAGDTFTVRLTAGTDGFNPVVLLANDENRVIQTFSAPLGTDFVGGVFTLENAGRYFLQIQGAGGSQGTYTLSLLAGDQTAVDSEPETVSTPTSLPAPNETPAETTAQPEPISAAQNSLFELVVGEQEDAAVSADTQSQSYTVRVGSIPLLLEARRASEGEIAFTLSDAATEDTVGILAPALPGGAFFLDSGTYTLTVDFVGGSFAVSYHLWLVPLGDAESIAESIETTSLTEPNLDAPTPVSPQGTAAAQPTNTPLAAADVDLVLRWDFDDLTLTNVSGAPVDISAISFTGDNRNVDTGYWLQSNPSLRLNALPPNACLGFRPLSMPDAPPLPPNCNNLGAWWSADIVYFWGGDTFNVLINGVPVATCETSAGTCEVALP